MKTKLDLVELGRQVMIAREAYNMNRPVDGPLKDGGQSDRDIYIGGHLADYVEAKLNERAAARVAELGAEVERLKAEGRKTETINELLKLRDAQRFPSWWYLALVAVSALNQIAYNIAKLNESRIERENQERLEQLERNV